MSYIRSLQFIQESKQVDLNNLSKSGIIKIEKLLKANNQLNDSFNITSIGLFIEAIQAEKEGVDFLLENPYLVRILTTKKYFKKPYKIKYDTDNESKIQSFFKTYLEQDLIECCNNSFSTGQYQIITDLLSYKKFLPVTIIHLIESKAESKLDYFFSIADKIVDDSSILSDSFVSLTRVLNSKLINRKLNSLRSLTMSYSIKAIGRPGLVHFFYVMSTSLSWIGKEPKTMEDRIEKKEVLKDFRFMFILLGVIFGIVFGVLTYVISKDNESEKLVKQKELQKFERSIYSYLTFTDSTKISHVEYLNETLSGELSPSYFKLTSIENSISKKHKIINNSSYDLIVLPDEELNLSFGPSLVSYYIKPKDSINANLLFNRIYVGKQLATFKSNSNDAYYSKNLPRFINPIASANELIKKRFEFRGGIELTEQNGTLIIKSNNNFFVNSVRYESYELKK